MSIGNRIGKKSLYEIFVALYLSKFMTGNKGKEGGKATNTKYPKIPGYEQIKTHKDTQLLFYKKLNNGREKSTFCNSLKNSVDMFDPHFPENPKAGWWQADLKGMHKKIFNKYKDHSKEQFENLIKKILRGEPFLSSVEFVAKVEDRNDKLIVGKYVPIENPGKYAETFDNSYIPNQVFDVDSIEKKVVENQKATERGTEVKKSVSDWKAIYEENQKLGLKGEEWVCAHEKDWLKKNGKKKLADKVRHVAKIDGDGYGYDVLSFDLDGSEKFIEVKTTASSRRKRQFYLTSNEYEVSKEKNNFWIYRVFNFYSKPNCLKIKAPLDDSLELKTSVYTVQLK